MLALPTQVVGCGVGLWSVTVNSCCLDPFSSSIYIAGIKRLHEKPGRPELLTYWDFTGSAGSLSLGSARGTGGMP